MRTLEKQIWVGALSCFVVAGCTGVFLRSIQLLGVPPILPWPGATVPLDPGHIRHAHSHLMYFGWVTPMLMMMAVQGRREFDALLRGVFVLAILSFVPFLLFGYEFAPIGDGSIRIPLSIAVSTSTILVWYAFAYRYRRLRHDLPQGPSRPYQDASLVFLVIASVGAWGLGAAMAIEPANPFWYQLALHLFLDLFAEGWLLIGVLGLAVGAAVRLGPAGVQSGPGVRPGPAPPPGNVLSNTQTPPIADPRFYQGIRHAWILLVAGIPTTFLLGIHPNLLPGPVRLLGSLGAVSAAFGFAIFIRHTWRRLPAVWWLPLGLLFLKIIGNVALSVPLVARWGLASGLRIPYLHLILLGIVTPGILAGVASRYGPDKIRGWQFLHVAILLMLVSMIPLTSLMPFPVPPQCRAWIVVTGAALPIAAMAGVLILACVRTSLPRKLHHVHREVDAPEPPYIGRALKDGQDSHCE